MTKAELARYIMMVLILSALTDKIPIFQTGLNGEDTHLIQE
jgi:hypothetical protein